MIRTRVGYAGGTTKNPTYYNLGDHSETVEIDYDPARVSYSDLLDVFWKDHDPSSGSWSRQYRAAVFYHNEGQKRLAEETRDRLASTTGKKIVTAIEPYTGFHVAEDYHQKHGLRLFHDLLKEFEAIYPDPGDFRNSTAVTRVNGYLGGYGDCASVKKEVDGFGLSASGREVLISTVCAHRPSSSCPLPD